MTLIATLGNDIIPELAEEFGSLAGNDLIDGLAGNDNIRGLDGNDTILGGEGNDTINGNQGADFVFGGDGDDSAYGGQGNDQVFGGAGNDFLFGDLGDDTTFGDNGNDNISGGDGLDSLLGNQGNDTIDGGAGNDTLFGGKDNDSLVGGTGDDFLYGDLGADTLRGGTGNDQFAIGRRTDISANTTTGGFGAVDADRIADFAVGQDKIRLLGGLTYGDANLVIKAGQASESLTTNDTVIFDGFTNQYLAVVLGRTVAEINQASNFVADTGATGAGPSLVGAEVLVANTAGQVGKVSFGGATSYSITGIKDNTGASVAGAVTVDSDGNLLLSSIGQTALVGAATRLDVTIKATKADGTTSDARTIKIYDEVSLAVGDTEIGNGTDTSDGTGNDTIKVNAGTYTQAVSITKSLTLLGNNAGTRAFQPTPSDPGRIAESILQGAVTFAPSSGSAVDKVRIDGFTFDSDAIAGSASVTVDKTSNLTLINNIFTDSDLTTANTATGIKNTVGVGVSGLTLNNNLIKDAQVSGVDLDAVTNFNISGNRVEGNKVSGIEVTGASSGVIGGNVIFAGATAADIGLFLNEAEKYAGTVTVSQNTLSGNIAGTFGTSVKVTNAMNKASNVTFTNNNLVNGGGTALAYLVSNQVGSLNAKSNYWGGGVPVAGTNFTEVAPGTVVTTNVLPNEVPIF